IVGSRAYGLDNDKSDTEEWLRAGAALFTAHCAGERRACGVEGDRERLYHEASFASLFRIRGNAMETLSQGIAASRQTAAVCVSRAAYGHSPDAYGCDRGEPGDVE